MKTNVGIVNLFRGTARVLVSAVLVFSTGAARAAEPAAPASELERRIGILAQEVEKLKVGEGPSKDRKPIHGLGPSAGSVYFVPKGVSLAGYGEMVYQNPAGSRDDGQPSRKLDETDFLRGVLYSGYRFSESALFNSEIEFEHASTGKGGEASVEFAYLDFFLFPKANVRAGLLLVPMGFVNEKHEPVTFPGALRPDVERFVIPSTWRENGVGVFGEIAPGLEYRAYLMAGLKATGYTAADGIRGGRQSGAKSRAEDFAVAARLDYVGRPGLIVGASVFTGEAGQGEKTPDGEGFGARTTLWDIHAEGSYRGLDLRALYVQGSIADADRINAAAKLTGSKSVGERLSGWYVQAAYDLLSVFRSGSAQSLAPFVRYERYNTQERVPAGFSADPANDRTTVTYGVTYKPIPNVAVKADWQDRKNKAGTGVDQFNLALAYMF